MKRYGKYEKQPEGVPEQQPKVKSVLLQTYFTSLLCLVLCVSMFFGTSYAWFTSEVQNTGNEIYIGTLDVELDKKTGETDGVSTWASLSETQDGVNTTKLFDSNIRWEPGYTALETIRVVNEGDLAFKYVLNFTDGAVAVGDTQGDSEKLLEVAQYFDVWVYDHRVNEGKDGVAANPASYMEIAAAGSGWEKAGSLDELLSGKIVLDGVMVTVRDNNGETPANDGTTDVVATEDTYTIALHMKEEAAATVMGHKISLNVKLVAYQMSSEFDSLGNSNYDSNVTAVSDAESLQSALSNGGNVQLITNVEINKAEDLITMNGGVLYGNGKTITYTAIKGEDEPSLGVVTTTGGTVSNLTIDGGTAGRALYITELTSNLEVTNCVLSGVYAFNLNSGIDTEYTLSFKNTEFRSWTSYGNVINSASFVNCKFNDRLRPYATTNLTDCTFTDATLDLSKLVIGETVKLVNCIYKDEIIAEVTITKTETGFTVSENSGLMVDGDGMVVPGNVTP